MQGNLVESLIGAIVLLVAGAFLYTVYLTTDVAGTGAGYRLVAQFNKVGGLALGSDVRIGGIKVGTVVKQELDPRTFNAVVTFTVDRKIELSEDTFASVSSEGLLGGYFLTLDPGGLPDILQEGDELEFTNDYVDLFDLISKVAFGGGDSGGSETQDDDG